MEVADINGIEQKKGGEGLVRVMWRNRGSEERFLTQLLTIQPFWKQ
jgi:hypothetical protein